jgi:hypothetical protein
VLRLAVMDVVPVGDAYDRADRDFSLAYWQWSFLAAPAPVPERFINAAPATLVDFMLGTWPVVKDAFPPEVRADGASTVRSRSSTRIRSRSGGGGPTTSAAARVPVGHFIPEEAPAETTRQRLAFLP